jgi:uncharacterized repeat protein (TIGR01451 family)
MRPVARRHTATSLRSAVVRSARGVLVTTLLSGVFAAATGGAPAYASGSADLTVKLENKVDAVPGKRIDYKVTVHNAGTTTASRVQIDFITSAALGSVTYSVRNGHCYRSPKETACVFYAALKPGASATATISGVLPKLANGTMVNNRVTLASNTHLINTADDKASDNYRVGIPRRLAPAAPSPSVNSVSKLTKVTNTASKFLDYSKHALTITYFVLGAAALWFAVGLFLRRRARIARGDFGDFGDED